MVSHTCIALLAAAVKTNEDKSDCDPSNDADNHTVPESVAFSFVTLIFFILKSLCDVLSDSELLRQHFSFRLFLVMWLFFFFFFFNVMDVSVRAVGESSNGANSFHNWLAIVSTKCAESTTASRLTV